ncbi:uncharacterized protein [Drosophila pseudoobscura]|uniref:Uncharacterized protein n=1 Tax=Drosophila pseudoobscura pseudoobscura TaxID=46245 RepID=A0A6I8VXM1_DROPS|nr:uncharacterized protein LOC117183918 [Drosophila pseudoobscura]
MKINLKISKPWHQRTPQLIGIFATKIWIIPGIISAFYGPTEKRVGKALSRYSRIAIELSKTMMKWQCGKMGRNWRWHCWKMNSEMMKLLVEESIRRRNLLWAMKGLTFSTNHRTFKGN